MTSRSLMGQGVKSASKLSRVLLFRGTSSVTATLLFDSLRPRDTYASANWAIIGSDNGFSPVLRQAII